MTFVLPLLCCFLGAGVVFLIMQKRRTNVLSHYQSLELEHAKKSVKKQMYEVSEDIAERLAAFADALASDRDFTIKLLVEKDPSAPEITEVAVRFRSAMGLSLLEITDSVGMVLSSGHFPASVGNASGEKISLLSNEPIMLEDNVMGMEALTFQAKHAFKIAEIPFYIMGGLMVDEDFLARLSPRDGVTVLLKQGSDILGMPGVKSISGLKNNKITINDKEYPAAKIELPFAGGVQPPEIFIIVMK